MTALMRLAVFGMAVLFASTAQSADRTGPYLGLRLVGSVAKVIDESATGFNGTFITNTDSDLVGGGGGVFGYRWAGLPIRTEVEIAHRVRFDWGVRDGGPPVLGYENNLESTNVLFNVLYEHRNPSSFTPFIGGTVGWARNRSQVDRTVIGSGTVQSKSNTVNNVAWGVMLGVDWAFTSNWSAEFAYRYIDLGEASSGLFAGGDGFDANQYSSHDILISILYAW
ncbi:MAG: outer membrane beta-barrel protein [Alphaproteobacteria bacterium]|nr:outer membrane beta-barrel protein [Alphaproteobacteria bacterium]